LKTATTTGDAVMASRLHHGVSDVDWASISV
jgi:hypothetical protein